MSSQLAKVSFPRLDSLRALCFLVVFFFHGFITLDPTLRFNGVRNLFKNDLLSAGDLGVNVFFVLSGFLITYLLLVERDARRRIDVPRFWLRRVLRIWPLYFLCVIFGFVVFPWMKTHLGEAVHETAHPLYYLFFASNVDQIQHGDPDATSLDPLWSVGVEEQFYLFWPLLLTLIPVRWYPAVFGTVIGGAFLFSLQIHGRIALHISSISCMGDLATGALGAWALYRANAAAWVRSWPVAACYGVHALLLFLFLGRDHLAIFSGRGEEVHRLLFACTCCLVILYQSARDTGPLLLPTSGNMARLGRISYGLYCLHVIALLVVVQSMARLGLMKKLWEVMLLQPALALLLTVIMAAISARFVEAPFLRWKKRFAYVVRPDAPQ